MSATVDSRVLEMRFDNSQFESGVKTSMSTLERLKQALHLKGASDGLEKVNSAARKCNLSPLSQGIDSVKVKFSALQVAGVAALANITNSAVNAGKNLVNAFAFEPIKTGFQEYETQIGAVQTILANTAHQGTNLEQVNAALDELNHYADKTIYNFTEMTSNIGRFTAAGVDLDTSVSAIKGISNLAAVSGSTSQQASSAMYQLSQALATGKVQLMDWNSVVNAGMGGKVFQDALIRTSELLGTGAKTAIKANGSFRESLTETGWLTSEVLNETLKQFAGAYTEADLIQQGYSESQAKEITNMAVTAEEAATKVKTFTQLMSTLKEAAQSGWTQSWETIVGDFEEAKTLWTKVSDTVGGMIQKSADDRNQMLSGALDSKWDTFIEKVNEAGVSTEDFQAKIKEAATEHGVNLDKMIEEQGSFREVVASGSLSSDIFVDALKKVSGSQTQLTGSTENLNGKLNDFQKVVDQVWQGDFKNGEERVKALTAAGYDYAEVQDLVNKTVDGHRLTLEDLSDTQLKSVGYTDEQISKIHELAEQAEQTGTPINDLIKQLERPSGRWLMIDSIKNAFTGITTALSSVKQAWKEAFYGDASDEEIAGIKAERLYNIIDGIHSFSQSLVMTEDTADKLKRTFRGVFSVFSLVSTFAGGALSLGFRAISGLLSGLNIHILDVTAGIGDAITRFKDWVKANDLVTKAFEKIGQGVKTAFTGIKNFVQAFSQLPQVQQFVSGIGQTFSTVFSNIRERLSDAVKMVKEWIEAFSNAKSLSDIGKVLESIGQTFSNFFSGFSISEMFNNIVTEFQNFRSALASNIEAAGVDLDGLSNAFGNVVKYIGSHLGSLVAIVSGVTLIRGISRIGDALELLSQPLQALTGLFGSISNAIRLFGEGMTRFFNARAFEARTEGIRNIAISIALLAGSLALLSQVDQGSLWSSVGALTVMTAVLSGVSVLVSRLGSIRGLGSLSVTLLALSTSLLLIAQCTRMINNLPEGGISKGLAVIAGFTAILTALMAATRLAAGSAIKGLGATMIQLGISMALLVGVIKMISGLEAGEIAKGLLVMVAFEGIIAGMAAITRLAGKNNFSKLGSTVMKLSIAMGLLVGVIRMISGIKPADLAKGILTMAALEGVIAGLAAISRLAGANAAKAGAMMLQLGLAFMALTAVIKIVEGMSPAGLLKGIVVIGALSTMVGALIAVSRFAGEHAARAGAMILMISGAMLILTGLIAIIDFMNIGALAKGLVVIGFLGMMMARLIAVSRFAGKAKSTIIALTIAITALVALVAALALLNDVKSVLPAAIALGTIMAAFAALIAATGEIKTENVLKSLGVIAALTLVVAALAGLVYKLSKLDNSDSVLKMAASLSLLVTALSTAAVILSRFKSIKPIDDGVIGSLAGLVVAVGILGIIIGALSKFDMKIGIESATSLSLLALSLSTAAVILSRFKSIKPIDDGVIGSLAGLVVAVGLLGGLIAALGKFDMNIGIESAASLSLLAVSLSAACLMLSYAGPDANAAIPAVAKLAAVLGVISGVIIAVGAIGALVENKLGAGTLDSITNALSKIGEALGSFFGGIVGGFSVQATNGLDEAGKNIAAFVESFSGISMEGVEGIKSVAEAIAILAGANFLNMLTEAFGGGSSNIETLSSQLPILGKGLSSFAASLGGLNAGDLEKIKMAGEAAKALAEFASEIPNQGGALANLLGDNMISSWGPQLPAFGKYLSEFSKSVEGIDTGAITQAADAAKALAEFADAIPNEGGYAGIFAGENSIGAWGPQLPAFGEYLTEFSNSVVNVNADAITKAAKAAGALALFAHAIPNEGGIAGKFVGENSLSVWGPQLPGFGEALTSFSQSVVNIDTGAITKAADAAKALAEFADAIPNQGGWLKKIIGLGDNDMSTFGSELVKFGESLSEFSQSLVDVDADSITKATKAAEGLSALADALPESGGFLSKFTADNDFSTFGNELEKFGKSLGKFSDSLEGADIESMTGAADSVGTLVSAFSRMKSLDTSVITSFKTALESLGEIDFATVLDSLSGIDNVQLDSLSELVTTLNSMARINTSSVTSLKETLTAISEIDFSSFKFDTAAADVVVEQLKTFRDKLKELCDSFSGIDFPAIDTAVQSLSKIRDLVQGMSGLDTTSVSSYITAVELLAGIEIGGIFTSGAKISVENISALGRLTGIIKGLVGIDTTGVGSYITAVELLSGMEVGGVLTGDPIKTDNLTGISMLTSSIRGMVGLDNSGVSAFTEGLKNLSSVEPKGILGSDGIYIDQTRISAINSLISSIRGMVGLETSGAESFKTAMKTLSEIKVEGILADGDALDTNLASNITSLVGAINSMAGIDTTGVESFKTAIEDISNITLGDFFQQLATFSTQAITHGVNIISNLAKGITQGSPLLTSAMNSAMQVLENAAKNKGPVLQATGQNLMASFASGLNSGRSQIGVGIINSALAPLLSAISAKGASFQSAGQALMSRFASGLTSGASRVPSAVNNIVQSALSMVNTKAGQFQSAGQNLISRFTSGMQSGGSKVRSTINTILSSALSSMSSKAGEFQTKGLVLISKTAQGIQSGSSIVNAATMSAVSSAANALSSYYSQFYSAGAYLMQGFAAGIDSQGAAAVAKAKSYAQQAASAVKSALEIASPSKVMYRLGRFAVMGFANAFRDGNVTALEVGTDLAMSAVIGFSEASVKLMKAQKKANDEQLRIEEEYWKLLLKERQNGIDGEMYQDMDLLDFKQYVTDKSIALLDEYTQALESNTQALLDNSNLFERQGTGEVDTSIFEQAEAIEEGSEEMESAGKKSSKAAKKVLNAGTILQNIRSKTENIRAYETAYTSLMKKLKDSPLTDLVANMGIEDLENLKLLDSMTVEELKQIEDAYSELTVAQAEFAERSGISAKTFLTNLEADNKKLEEYKEVYSSLIQKVKDSPLADIIAEMGLEDLEQLKIINGMTEEELAKATELLIKKEETAAAIAEIQTASVYQQNMVSKSIELVQTYTDAIEQNTASLRKNADLFNEVKLAEKMSGETMYNNQQNNVLIAQRAAKAMGFLRDRLYETAEGQIYFDEVVSKMSLDQVQNIETLANMNDHQLGVMVSSYTDYLEETKKVGIIKSSETATEVENTLSDLFGGIDVQLDDFVEKFDGSFDSIEEYIQGKKADFVKSGEDIATSVSNGINNCLPLVKEAAEKLIAQAQEIITKGMQALRGSIQGNAKEAVADVGAAAGAAASDGKIEEITGSSVSGAVAKGIKAGNAYGLTSAAKKLGSSISSGLANGIKSGGKGVAKAAGGLATAAVVAISTAMKIHSPSRVTYALGEYSTQGFVNAFYDYESKAYEAGSGIANSSMNGLSQALSRIQDVVDSDIDTQPTIRPVLDLSDLTDGTSRINDIFALTPSVGLLSKVGSINASMGRIQNGTNDDVIDAINKLGDTISSRSGDTYSINGITYDDGSNVSDAIKTIVRAARVERRR